MISLKNEVSISKFNKHSRCVYGITCNSAIPRLFLTKDSAYLKMEQIKRQLISIEALESETLDDLDVRPTTLKSEAGSVYELITLSIDY